MAHALERCRREGQGIGVIFFDLDHLKTVNDTAGHEVGDDLLRAVAAAAAPVACAPWTLSPGWAATSSSSCARTSTTTPSSTSVVVPHDGARSADPVDPARPATVGQRERGRRRAATPPSTVAQLLSQADAAMYQAKERARGSVARYDPSTRRHLEKRAEGSRLLRLALEAPPDRPLLPTQWSTSTTGSWSGRRPWCAGRTLYVGSSRPRTSCPWPKSSD